jgi:copper oxidase (laccase) domain-containing protein
MGPAAQLCCYEVSSVFIQKVAEAEMFSRLSENDDSPLKSVVMLEDKFYVSIPKLVERQLIAVGIQKSKIYRAKNCTICDPSFFSYRKDGELAGRQLTYLSINSAS